VIEEKVIGAHGKGPSVKGEETKWCRRKKCEEKITEKRKGKGEDGGGGGGKRKLALKMSIIIRNIWTRNFNCNARSYSPKYDSVSRTF
jgi:hypothetical protein